MNQFKINPNIIHKSEEQRLLLVSTDTEKNEVYEFEGNASLLLLKLIDLDLFTFKNAQEICQELKASPEDLLSLWELCLAENIIIPRL